MKTLGWSLETLGRECNLSAVTVFITEVSLTL